MSIRSQLQELWAGERGPVPAVMAAITAPLATLFGTGVALRNFLYDVGVLPSRSAPVPVISVGNLAVGGTGKTPVSGWLVGQLEKRGWKPALVIRGYGEDETLLHRRWNPDTPVIVASRRVDGTLRSVSRGRDIVVLDDGFQHRGLRRDLDIVLLSSSQRLPPRLMPRGPFREPLRSLRRAQAVLVTAKGVDRLASARAIATEIRRFAGPSLVEPFLLRPGPWESLEGTPTGAPPGAPVALCSIAEPARFQELVSSRVGEEAELVSFPDHYRYTEDVVRGIATQVGNHWVATTEKDAVKLLPFRELLPTVRVLPLVPAAGVPLADQLLQLLDSRRPSGESVGQ